MHILEEDSNWFRFSFAVAVFFSLAVVPVSAIPGIELVSL
jgi:hypothetical protein